MRLHTYCHAVQRGDQYFCDKCRLQYDISDSEPLECKTKQQIQDDINKRGIEGLRYILRRHDGL